MLKESEDRIVHAIDRLLVTNNTIISLLGGGSGGSQTLTSTSETGSTNSPIIAGASSISFTTNSSFAGTINGITRSASTSYTFSSAQGERLPAVAFTVTAGAVIIDRLI